MYHYLCSGGTKGVESLKTSHTHTHTLQRPGQLVCATLCRHQKTSAPYWCYVFCESVKVQTCSRTHAHTLICICKTLQKHERNTFEAVHPWGQINILLFIFTTNSRLSTIKAGAHPLQFFYRSWKWKAPWALARIVNKRWKLCVRARHTARLTV